VFFRVRKRKTHIEHLQSTNISKKRTFVREDLGVLLKETTQSLPHPPCLLNRRQKQAILHHSEQTLSMMTVQSASHVLLPQQESGIRIHVSSSLFVVTIVVSLTPYPIKTSYVEQSVVVKFRICYLKASPKTHSVDVAFYIINSVSQFSR
jgi:hypothetical protein